uniref:Tudor domain-containing protein n=1 Tax=Plectus sambesii TaxID=2011161 RepID=A0A914WW62_9BILA
MCAAALKGFKYRVALGDTAGDVTDEGDYSATVVAEQSKLVIRGLPALLIPADLHGYLDVLVCSVAEVDRVFVQLLNESDNLDWTTCMLQAVYNDPYADGVEVLLNPQRGQLCVVKSRSDGRWYRACVIERASPSDVTVYYLDYGKSDTVDKKTVRSITTLLSSRPPQAIAVSLANVSCTDAQLDLFNVRAFLENRQVTLHLEATTGVALVASMTYVDANGAHIIVNDVIMGRSHSNYAPVKANSLIQSRPFVNSSKAAIVGSDQSHNTLERPTRIGDVPTRKLIGSVHRVIDQEKQLPFDTSR